MTLSEHPLSHLFPPMSPAEFEALQNDIKVNGLRDPVRIWHNQIIDGRHRFKACTNLQKECRFIEHKGGEENLLAFVISMNLQRRHLDESQRAMVAERVATMRQGNRTDLTPIGGTSQTNIDPIGPKSLEDAADMLSVGRTSVIRARQIRNSGNPELIQAVENGEKTIHAALKEIKSEQAQTALKEAQSTISIKDCDLRVMSCAELFASGIKPDAVITDPPYPKEFLPVFSELALAAKDVSMVAVMSGQSYLPEVLKRLCEHLKYRWTSAYLTPGQATQQFEAKVNISWKPVFIFGEPKEWFGDVSTSQMNDKRFHNWGQSESGIADIISKLTKPGDLICDPFLGGGTTAIVALSLGRRFVGCDIDSDCVEITKKRLNLWQEQNKKSLDGVI